MNFKGRNYGIGCVLGAALLFGASTPLAKVFLETASPFLVAGLLYLGSGLGLGICRGMLQWRRPDRAREARLQGKDWSWFLGAVIFGGLLAPILLMEGLRHTEAAGAALLLNFEAVATAAIAWIVFKENVNKRVFLGFLLIVSGGILLALPSSGLDRVRLGWGSLAIIGACLGWGIDNNLTRKVSGCDPLQITMLKGLIAGTINTALALFLGANLPDPGSLALVGIVGFFGYGLSLMLFVLALRHLGTARTGAYFSLAPFAGAFLAVFIWRTELTPVFLAAGLLMVMGVWLHLSEHHEHEHSHQELEHDHLHVHDEHHQHAHLPSDPRGEPHSHPHRHQPLTHSHRHDPDIHHQHSH